MRRFGKWVVLGAGLLLVGCGVAAMASGWDQILIERGWSLFIAGAMLIAGGTVTASLSVVIGRLDALGVAATAAPGKAEERVAEGRLPERLSPLAKSRPPDGEHEAESPSTPAMAAATAEAEPATVEAQDKESAPTVIDHYESGGASYVMYSDGSVDVQTEFGVRRYASLAELRGNLDG